ncbi:DUF6879 family protein [Streptosporangium saharense]|uniref:DUF6879 family protein n=1 Tax=Streptosporangium saharense TaxID=1706840 RepID=UPI0036D1089B
MHDLPRLFTGQELSSDEYLEDFYPRFWEISEGDFWKLERIQSFQEDGSDSWDAFDRGEWDESFRLIEERRESLAEYYAQVAHSGFTTYRVRVVEEDVTPYLRWQLRSLCQRSELGERIRVVGPDAVGPFERDGSLPEIVTLGTHAVYQVLYSHDGALRGAVRSDRPEDVSSWREFIEGLYAVGEEIGDFCDRRAASLEPPRGLS